jgi:D-lactate dehydrogenase
MKKIIFYDTKPYDKIYFDKLCGKLNFDYIESKLNSHTAVLSAGYDAAVAFVNDKIDAKTIDVLYANGVKLIALRCAGFNNVDFKSAYGKVHIARVPAYSPYAVAEHAMALLLTLNRKIHKAFNRVREFNFSLNGLTGFDIHGKTIGVIGTGKIGKVFIDISKGFGAEIIAYDPYPTKDAGIKYVTLEEIYKNSDIISLHCPLTNETKHIINKESISKMKKGAIIINTSRGGLIDSEELLKALINEKIGGAALDVYEEESEFFYEDMSTYIIKDDILARLITMPNVVITSHQAFLTHEALYNIAETTIKNINDFFDGKPLENEICYRCTKFGSCKLQGKGRCF